MAANSTAFVPSIDVPNAQEAYQRCREKFDGLEVGGQVIGVGQEPELPQFYLSHHGIPLVALSFVGPDGESPIVLFAVQCRGGQFIVHYLSDKNCPCSSGAIETIDAAVAALADMLDDMDAQGMQAAIAYHAQCRVA